MQTRTRPVSPIDHLIEYIALQMQDIVRRGPDKVLDGDTTRQAQLRAKAKEVRDDIGLLRQIVEVFELAAEKAAPESARSGFIEIPKDKISITYGGD